MFCSKCGAEAIEGSRFCRRCGAPLEEQAGKAIEKGIQRGAAQRLPGRPRKPLLRLPTGRKAAMVSGLVIALIGAALGGYIGLGGRLPGLARDSGGTVIALPDGASINIPSKAVEGKPKVVARVVAPEDMPPLPDWVQGAPVLYEFTVDRPLRGAAELRIPLPRDADLALLSHYHDGSWKPVPFRIEGKMAVAEVTQLSLFGFLVVGYDKLERWLQGHPLINWALGGGTQAAGSPCEREAPGVTVRVDGTPRAVSACAQSGIGGTEVVVRNDRRFYLDVYPVRGDLQWARGGLPWSCCDGRILPPEGRAAWLWQAPDGEAVLEVRFTVQAAGWTIARLLVAPIGAWAWSDPASGELLQMLQEVARWVPTVDATVNIFAQLMSDRPDYAVVARELARFFSNPDALAAVLEKQLRQGVLTRAGIYATSAALRKLLVLPTVANQMRTAADLVAAALGGGVAALVTATPSGRTSGPPSASTPGGKIAFVSVEAGGRHWLYLMDANGRNRVKMPADLGPVGVKHVNGDMFESPPFALVSPDRRYIAHYENDCPRVGVPPNRVFSQPIVVRRWDGTEPRVIDDKNECFHDLASGCGFDWSPDGTRIVFCSWSAGEPRIYVAKADGSGRSYIAKGVYPAWSPRGDAIAFSVRTTNNEGEEERARCAIYTVKPDGSDQRRLAEVLCPLHAYDVIFIGGPIWRLLTPDRENSGEWILAPRPLWSRDGSYLVFAAATRAKKRDTRSADIFLLRVDDSALINLTNDESIDRDPIWVDCGIPTAGCEAVVTHTGGQKLGVRYLDLGAPERNVAELTEGDTVCIIGRPIYLNGKLLWPVTTRDGNVGWVAGRDPQHADTRWLTPTGRTCPPLEPPASTSLPSIREVDFQNFVFHDVDCPVALHPQAPRRHRELAVQNGAAEVVVGTSEFDRFTVAVRGVVYGDLTGDGREEAVVALACVQPASNHPILMGYATLYVYTLRDGSVARLAMLTSQDLARDLRRYYDAGFWGAGEETISGGELMVKRFSGFPLACPPHVVTFRYRLEGESLRLVGRPAVERNPHC